MSNDDVIKACAAVRELAQDFLINKMFKCDHNRAVFIVDYYSTIYSNVKLEVVDDGVKVIGSKTKIDEGLFFMVTEKFGRLNM